VQGPPEGGARAPVDHRGDQFGAEAPAADPAPPAATGTGHTCAKLAPDDVRDIRRLKAEGMSTYTVAKQFRVQGNSIRAILTGRTWRDV